MEPHTTALSGTDKKTSAEKGLAGSTLFTEG